MEQANKLKRLLSTSLLLTAVTVGGWAQSVQIEGSVSDRNGEPIIGASVQVKGQTGVGTVSDLDGHFKFDAQPGQTLVVTYIGMKPMEVKIGSKRTLTIVLDEDNEQLNEVIVVGYGQQKKASVVGAITQTTGETLKHNGGVTDLSSALAGNLPGVNVQSSTGMPGSEDTQIVIRAASSWNNSDPLVLVDGIERPMSSVDINSVATISVLKDASATAVYGVKGANGVILITTKRGQEGKAQINATYNFTVKAPSKLPSKYDSYDALMYRNVAIERELGIASGSWDDIMPQSVINMYRNQTTQEQRERYPNVDWQDVLFKDATTSYSGSVDVSGGTKFVKYFAAVDYAHEGDLYRTFDTGRGYDAGYGYNRVNMRSNLDFQLTKTTVFKMNLSGSSGQRKTPYSTDGSDYYASQQWAGAYNISPDAFYPLYSDGSWGYYPKAVNVSNSAEEIALAGINKITTTRITTDFTLEQDLSFITPGLRANAMIAWDNTFVETNRGINDLYNSAQHKYIDPLTGEVTYENTYDTSSLFDFQQGVDWTTEEGEVDNSATVRNLNYHIQLDWARQFGLHNVTLMGLWSRQEEATGSEIPHYREDWVFRTTYNFANRYFFEYNGAYNGSEKFSSDNRFAFFSSGAIGWMLSEEKFMNFSRKWLDMLKLRLSYGEIGDDNVGTRWLYLSQWAYGGNTVMDTSHNSSPYTWYYESTVGNENAKWETVKKFNFGIDYSFLNNMFAGSIDFFRDKRVDILLDGSSQSVMYYYGATPATANLGEVTTHGYELELRFNKQLNKNARVWANLNMTHAVNKVEFKDDPDLYPDYQKSAGYSMNQQHAYVDYGFISSYDELYGSTKHDTSDDQKLVGDYNIIDYNADGVIDSDDSIPYGYTDTPQNTYSATLGFEWKGLSVSLQFYGVKNVTRYVALTDFYQNLDNVYDNGTWWTSSTNSGEITPSRWTSTPTYNEATMYYYDGSYIRLKNAEIAYTFDSNWVKKLGISALRIYINGNNLWQYSHMPDDRESNFASSNLGAYPMMKRYNIGLKVTL